MQESQHNLFMSCAPLPQDEEGDEREDALAAASPKGRRKKAAAKAGNAAEKQAPAAAPARKTEVKVSMMRPPP
jgi:hypothetical protein